MQVGAFNKGSASDAAKQLWASHLGFSQGRLDMSAGIGGERLNTAPPLPKQGGPDDPGRMLKDWSYYKYRPNASMASSLNKYGPDYRWPGLNNAPEIRHHLVVVPRPRPKTTLDISKVWTDLPRMEAGPGFDYIAAKEAASAAAEDIRRQSHRHHRSTMKQTMQQTTLRREQLQARAFREPAFRASR